MPVPYEVIEQKEIMNECFAGLLADLSRILSDRRIDETDTSNSLVVFYRKMWDVFHSIYGSTYKTMNDMQMLRGLYLFARDYVHSLEEENAGRLYRHGA